MPYPSNPSIPYRVIATATRGNTDYELRANSELWTTGEHAYHCGYVSDPIHMDEAIDEHELEMRCLMDDARAEFADQTKEQS